VSGVEGPEIIVRSISAAKIPDKHGNVWQYHSRSDKHSKVPCWVIAFELMQSCELFREHLATGKVVLGINHTMRDFQTQRKKDLDLVIARPASDPPARQGRTFAELGQHFGVVLTTRQQEVLASLPVAREGPVGSVLVALEAKACMTAHVKALPRLHDELDSSHQTTHGNSRHALAVGFVMVNASKTFVSPGMNKVDLTTHAAVINPHHQPADAIRVIEKVKEIRRTSGSSGAGFDALGIMVIDLANDGSPVRLVSQPTSPFPYSAMVERVAHEYAANFKKI
jgi:hypothetical protein